MENNQAFAEAFQQQLASLRLPFSVLYTKNIDHQKLLLRYGVSWFPKRTVNYSPLNYLFPRIDQVKLDLRFFRIWYLT